LLPLHDTKAVVARHLKECNEEENVRSQHEIMELEHEKSEILSVSKDKELDILRQECR
jgi:hypothetical protein